MPKSSAQPKHEPQPEPAQPPLELFRQWQHENPLREFRRLKGFTLSEAAAVLGVSPSTIQHWEDGVRAPAEEHATRLWRLLSPAQPEAATSRWTDWADRRPVI